MDNLYKSHGKMQNKGVYNKHDNFSNSLKKRIMTVFFVMMMLLQLSACSLQISCKADGCNETDIYEDGYCRYHYYLRAGENLLKEIIN